MRNQVLAILLVTILVLGSIYTAFWFKKSGEFKQAIEQTIAQINETAKTKKDTPTIKYASIDVSGFPFFMQFNINKPVMDIPVSEIAKSALPATSEKPVNVVLETSYDLIAIGTDVTASNFSLGYSGETTFIPLLDGKAGKAIQFDTTSPVFCHMKLHNNNFALWNVSSAFNDADSFFTAFRSIDCRIDGASSKDTASNTTLSTLESMQFTITNTPQDQVNHKLTLLLDIKNARALPAYDSFANYYVQMFYDLAGTPKGQRDSDLNLSQYSNQNSKIDISYEGPVNKDSLISPTANIHFDIASMNFRNAVYEWLTEMHLSNGTAGNARNAAGTIHWSLTAGEPYEHVLAQQFAKLLRQPDKDPTGGMLAAETAAYNPDELANALVPKFHTLGKLSFDSDVAFKGEVGKDFMAGTDITLNQLDIMNSWYGIKMKGNGKTGAGPMPTGELLATCVLCDTLVDGIAGYAVGIDSILRKSRPGQVPYVTAPLVTGVKQFLHALDEPAANKAPGSILIHVVAGNDGNITISGKQIMEVMSLFGSTIGPYLPQSQPEPAATAPATPQVPAKTKPAAKK